MTTNLRGREQRLAAARELGRLYETGLSIRQLAAHTGRSYCYVHRLLQLSTVPMRPRGSWRTQQRTDTTSN